MTVLASSSLQMRSTCSRARASSLPARSTSIYLPCRTSLTPLKPRPASAPSIAFPCGSSTPPLSVILMRAFMIKRCALNSQLVGLAPSRMPARCPGQPAPSMRLGAHQHRARSFRARILCQHAKPARHFLVGLEHAAQIAAQAILVEFVGGRRVPEPAAVRADLIGQDDAHLLVLPEPAKFHLEIDEADANAGK